MYTQYQNNHVLLGRSFHMLIPIFSFLFICVPFYTLHIITPPEQPVYTLLTEKIPNFTSEDTYYVKEAYITTIKYIYIYRFYVSVYSPLCDFVHIRGTSRIGTKSHSPTGRAGGARADDNFTKKPQKKLIRYMILFWGASTNS